ncbi:MAG: hypothetical protein ACRD6X_06035 [Pyrinomonadaceae bacterium]
MFVFYRRIVTSENLRRVFALAFLFFLLAEWGSHGVIFAHASSSEGQAFSAKETGHEDPCKTLIQCTDGKRQNQQVPNLGHDASQHNAFFDRLSNLMLRKSLYKEPQLTRERVSGLFRPVSPPFHPPEIS